MTDLALAPGPSRPSTFHGFGDRGDHPAIATATMALSYAQLDARAAELADALGPERRLVAIEAASTVPALVAYLGAMRGGHPVLLLPPGAGHARHPLVEAYDPDVVLTGASGWAPDARRDGTSHLLHDDLALLLSTSGSTGAPRLVRLSHENLEANAGAIGEYLGLGPEDRAITTLPMHYCFGLSVLNSHLRVGGTVVLTDLSVVDRCFWDLFSAAGATSLAGVPHTFDLLDRVDFATMSLPSLRYVTQAGGRMHPDVVRRYAELGERQGWELFVMYGQTEATARMAYLPPALARRHPHAIGVPIPGGAFDIDTPDARGVGELVYRGANVMLGYADDRDDLALGATVGALRTGDLARRTPEGLYEIVGRRSRFIKPFGIRVDLDRLEAMLAEEGVVSLCAGDDHSLVVAVTRPGHAAAAHQLVTRQIALPRSLASVVCVDELPRLPNGKPDHAAVHRLATTPPQDPMPVAVGEDRLGVRAAYGEVLGADPSDDDTFVSLGGDSLTYVEMSIRLEQLLGALPRDWHLQPVGDVAPARRPGRFLAPTDASAVLRATAIVLVVATHVGLWHLPGGAHALLAVAGYNFARFQLRGGSILTSVARIAVPSMCWIGIVAAVSHAYGWPNALLVNGFVERPGDRWSYWFIEALVLILVPVAVLNAIPAISRLERRLPFALPCAVATAGLLVRFDVIEIATTHRTSRPHEVFWLFALGWAAARAPGWPQQLLVSVLAAVGLVGFFGDTSRELIILAAILLILWVPTVPMPRLAQRLIAPVAAASLYIYLTHWQVYPPLERLLGPEAAVAGSVLAGISTWQVARPLTAGVERAIRGRGRRSAARAGSR